jgi:hypothetical protein
MASPQQQAQVVVWYAETKSFIMVQRNYRRIYGDDAPDTKTTKAWFDKFRKSSHPQRGGPRFVYPKVADLQPNIIYQQDGAPPYWSLHIQETMTRTFPDHWIGHDGPISWPPRSPDITLLNFFFWEYVKDRVYATSVPDLPTLRDHIRDVIYSVTPDMLDRTWQEIKHRLEIICATSGSHVEMY